MTIKFLITVALGLVLMACGDHVPHVDPDNIVVDGAPMKPGEFLQRYCMGKSNNETCARVIVAARKSSMRGSDRVQW